MPQSAQRKWEDNISIDHLWHIAVRRYMVYQLLPSSKLKHQILNSKSWCYICCYWSADLYIELYGMVIQPVFCNDRWDIYWVTTLVSALGVYTGDMSLYQCMYQKYTCRYDSAKALIIINLITHILTYPPASALTMRGVTLDVPDVRQFGSEASMVWREIA